MDFYLIEFDGGTPCNIPRLGFGIGYGSYRINKGEIVKVDHKVPMSCNVAEILTLVEALKQIPNGMKVKIKGDSQLVLNRVRDLAKGKEKPPSKGATELFIQALILLKQECQRLSWIEVEWQPRIRSVEVFGH